MLGRLREGVTPADCYDSYVCACAWMALSALDGARDGGVEAFTAGTLSVRRASGKILGLDRRYALEMVCAGEVSVEFDKLIDRQLERAAISSISGFAKICDNACASLTI